MNPKNDDLYKKFGLINFNLQSAMQYSESGDGDFDVNRFFEGQPAFVSQSEDISLKKKTIVINDLIIPGLLNHFTMHSVDLFKFSVNELNVQSDKLLHLFLESSNNQARLEHDILVTLKFLLDDGFELFSYFDKNQLTLLNHDSLVNILDKKAPIPRLNEQLHQCAIKDLKRSYDNIAVLDIDSLSKMAEELNPKPKAISSDLTDAKNTHEASPIVSELFNKMIENRENREKKKELEVEKLPKKSPNLSLLNNYSDRLGSPASNQDCNAPPSSGKPITNPFAKKKSKDRPDTIVNENTEAHVDAETNDPQKTYNLQRIFFPIQPNCDKPDPRNYRLISFDTLEMASGKCDASSVFTKKNTAALDFASPQPEIEISSTDVYQDTHDPSISLPCYYAKVTLSVTNQWQALPSLSANETITKLHTDPAIPLDIQYSKRDNLYYIRNNSAEINPQPTDVSIDFIVQCTQEPMIRSYENSDLKTLIGYCADFQKKSLDMKDASASNGQDFIMAMAKQKVGSCRHRTAVFKALFDNCDLREQIPALKNLNLSNYTARIISNDCHSYIEVKEQNQNTWVKCDLGGYLSELNISEDAKPDSHILPPIRDYFPPQKPLAQPNALSYIQKLSSENKPKRLIECNTDQLAGLYQKLQDYHQDTSRPYYAIDSARNLILNSRYTERNEFDLGIIKSGAHGPVYQFLLAKVPARTLIINYENFTAAELARYNSLLDEEPHIDGFALPEGTQIIALIPAKEYKDTSLYSRFSGAVETCPVDASELPVTSPFITTTNVEQQEKPLIIDFYAAPNWKAKLLGTWRLTNQGLLFVRGQLLTTDPLPKQIILNNPPLGDPEFTCFFTEAKRRGTIQHEGIEIPFDSTIALSINNEFVFAEAIIQSIQYASPEDAQEIINPSVFFRFLKQYTLKGNTLIEDDGIFKQHENKTLKLYISESLSKGQWSQLLAECQQHKVSLEVRLAPCVTLPEPLSTKLASNRTVVRVDEPSYPALSEKMQEKMHQKTDYCVLATDQDFTLAQLQQDHKDCLCINVSELTSSQLIKKITAKINEEINEKTASLNFSEETGALLVKLAESKTVILNGTFSNDMRQKLHDLLFHRKKENNGQIIIVSDNNTVNTFVNLLPVYQHLYPASNHLPHVKTLALLRQAQGYRPEISTYAGLSEPLPNYTPTGCLDLNQAEKITLNLNQSRLDAVNKTLEHSPFVFLAGMSGVGKTTFVETIWQNNNAERRLYKGEKNILAWAQDKKNGTKALFIDEANLTSNQWSQFEGLFINQPPGIMIGNQYVELSASHKVIFAGNPTTYSDDRNLPELFARHGNSVVFEPLPPEYIYHALLKPLFANDTRDAMNAISQPILEINEYLNQLSQDAVLLTPRELIMMTQLAITFSKQSPNIDAIKFAAYFAYQLARPFVPEKKLAEFDAKYKADRPQQVKAMDLQTKDSKLTLTESNQSSAEMLHDFLCLREAHIQSPYPITLGLGGVVLEGEPGLGKSELAMAVLRAHGFTKYTGVKMDDKKYFYHLPSGATIQKRREILLSAFTEGAVVLCDEINTTASQEELLNQLLMGKSPEDQAPKPGFLLIGTQNPSTMAGRAKTSEALLHRMHYRVLPPYSDKEMATILRNLGLPNRRVDELIYQYSTNKTNGRALCFRDIIDKAEEDLRVLFKKNPQHMRETDLLALLDNTRANAETLEIIYRHRLCTQDMQKIILKHSQIKNAPELRDEIENDSILKIIHDLAVNPDSENDATPLLTKLETFKESLSTQQQLAPFMKQLDKLKTKAKTFGTKAHTLNEAKETFRLYYHLLQAAQSFHTQGPSHFNTTVNELINTYKPKLEIHRGYVKPILFAIVNAALFVTGLGMCKYALTQDYRFFHPKTATTKIIEKIGKNIPPGI